MIGNSLASILESFSGHSVYGLLTASLYGLSKYLAEKTADEATKKILIQPLLKKLLPKWDEPSERAPAVIRDDFSRRLTEYLEQNSRSVEAILRCLEQLAERMDRLDESVSRPVLVALGLPTDMHTQQPASNDAHVRDIVNDQAPGLPQSIKSGYALLHLRRGNKHLAELYARSTISVSPAEPKAWYVLGLLKLQDRIADISPPNANEAERCLATASEAGLAAQCALPRAALRFDHHMRKGRTVPSPSLHALGALYGSKYEDARIWPYGPLNDKLPSSIEFKRLWKA